MKLRHRGAVGFHVRTILKACNITAGQPYDRLTPAQLALLLRFADRDRYQKPRASKKSRVHCYYDQLTRRHAWPKDDSRR